MTALFSAIGWILMVSFVVFGTVGIWLIGLASFLQWVGVIS